ISVQGLGPARPIGWSEEGQTDLPLRSLAGNRYLSIGSGNSPDGYGCLLRGGGRSPGRAILAFPGEGKWPGTVSGWGNQPLAIRGALAGAPPSSIRRNPA